MIKELVNWYDSYFRERENFVKETNKAEFIWVWNHHYRIISEILQNKSIVDISLKMPQEEDYDTTKLNDFYVIHYRLEDSYREIKDDYKVTEEKKR